jgi:membrane protease YdiL (CAAX protease family)
MNSFMMALAICAYGSQSIFQTRFIPIAISLLCLCILTLRRQHLGAFLCVCTLSILGLSEVKVIETLWPLPSVLVSVLGALYLVKTGNTSWFGFKSIKPRYVLASVALGLLAFAGVALWVHFMSPSVEQIPFKIPSSLSLLLVGLLIVVFAILNSFAEEFIFRGLIIESIGKQSVLIANIVQAIAFGLLHFKGFPFGVSGSILAGFFALLMGVLRIKSGSLAYSWFAHFTANVAMGILLYQMASAGSL